MYAFFVLVAALVLLGAALAATGRGEGLVAAAPDRPVVPLPDGDLAARDVADLRLPLAVRGYRMADVDAALDRLADEIDQRDGRIAALERRLAGGTHEHEEER